MYIFNEIWGDKVFTQYNTYIFIRPVIYTVKILNKLAYILPIFNLVDTLHM
jgi:hypothetical protein